MGCGNKRLMFCYCPILNMCIALSEQAYSLAIFFQFAVFTTDVEHSACFLYLERKH